MQSSMWWPSATLLQPLSCAQLLMAPRAARAREQGFSPCVLQRSAGPISLGMISSGTPSRSQTQPSRCSRFPSPRSSETARSEKSQGSVRWEHGHRVEQERAVLAAGETDSDAVSFFNEAKFAARSPHFGKEVFVVWSPFTSFQSRHNSFVGI